MSIRHSDNGVITLVRTTSDHVAGDQGDTQMSNKLKKKEILSQLRSAKSAHIKWRSYAQALVAGLPLDDGKVPVIHTDCNFGRWYYGQGQVLSSLEGYRAIEEPHEMLHNIYMKIVKKLFHEEDPGLLKKMLGSRKRADEKRATEVHELMEHLINISRTLLESIEMVEREVLQMHEEEFTALV